LIGLGTPTKATNVPLAPATRELQSHCGAMKHGTGQRGACDWSQQATWQCGSEKPRKAAENGPMPGQRRHAQDYVERGLVIVGSVVSSPEFAADCLERRQSIAPLMN